MNMYSRIAKGLALSLSVMTSTAVMSQVSEDNLLIINGTVNQDCVLEGRTFITPEGDLRVQVRDETDCVGAPGAGLAVSSLFVDQTSVFPGESLEFNWISVGAATCAPSGNLPGWTAQTIGLNGPVSFDIPTATTPSTYSASVDCFSGEDAVTSNSVSVQINETQIDAPPLPDLSVTPSTTQQGGSVEIEWNAPTADGCSVPSGTSSLPGWTGSKGSTGSEIVNIGGSLATGNYNVRLRCQNAGGSSPIRTRTVSVQDVTPSACGANQSPPSSMTRATNCTQNGSADCRSYDSVFGEFPGSLGIARFVLSQNQYAAMAFTPSSVPASGRVQINADFLQTGFVPTGQLLWSISNCPGDFRPETASQIMGDEACLLDGFSANTGFKFGGAASLSSETTCALLLDPGTTYYLNIVYTFDDPNQVDGGDLSWDCSEDECGHQLQPINIDGWD